MHDVLICDYVRTPIGRHGGALSSIRTDDLAAVPLSALLARNATLDPEQIDEVILGCANQAGEDNRNVARMALLLAGMPDRIPGVTVNRLCASGLEAVVVAGRSIMTGEIDVAIAGGVESMSRAPFVMLKTEVPFSRSVTIEDTTIGWRFVNPKMEALHGVDSMPETAENLAVEFGISRSDQDLYAFKSQQKTSASIASGRLAKEIVPVHIPQRRGGDVRLTDDEHPRPDVTIESLAKLRPVVRPEGSVTAGNSSGINDGAAALLLASESAARRFGLNPIARLAGAASAGVAPRIMGYGPVPAIRKLLARQNLQLDSVDLIEINEAFASQVLADLRGLRVADDDERVNPNGGAIALGHPLGMSGARIAGSAAVGLSSSNARRALVSMCVGVGQGVAVILERL
jgi:3-oxoadipyl-CoA thiolase